MGYGSWTSKSFTDYAVSKKRSVSYDGSLKGDYSNQEIFEAKTLDSALNPKNVMRECCDTEEHPNTLPVILALDVTGSMGQVAVEVAKKLNVIMTKLYDKITDVEFLVMGIGDLACDYFPVQASQFESDIRIAEQLDKIYFEFGGGGNRYESYTAAWYFGSRHTKLDCLKRERKGIIITMGDEQLNPYLPINGRVTGLNNVMGDNVQGDIETKDLYSEASEKFNIYHLDVNHRKRWDECEIAASFKKYLDDNHFKRVTLDSIADEIVNIIINEVENSVANTSSTNNNTNEIAW